MVFYKNDMDLMEHFFILNIGPKLYQIFFASVLGKAVAYI